MIKVQHKLQSDINHYKNKRILINHVTNVNIKIFVFKGLKTIINVPDTPQLGIKYHHLLLSLNKDLQEQIW